MKIGIIGSRGYPHVYSGYETLVTHLAPALAGRGHDVTVYCHRRLFDSRPEQHEGVRLVYARGSGRPSLSQLTHSLSSTFHAVWEDFDIVLFVNSANGPFGWFFRPTRTKSVINVDGLEWLRPKWRGLGAKYFRWSSGVATRAFDSIVTDADAMARVYETEFDAASTTIAYGSTIGESRSEERVTRLGLSPKEYYLVVGRLIPDNNVDLLIDGYEASGSGKQLVIVGDIAQPTEFSERVKSTEHPGVVFLGYVRDQTTLQELYCNCFSYLHGHEFGGTNPALLKALGFGTCVLALDTRFSREVLDGSNHGRYFEKTTDSVATAMRAAEADPEGVARLRAGARDRIRERYTWERVVGEYETLFNELVAHEPATLRLDPQ